MTESVTDESSDELCCPWCGLDVDSGSGCLWCGVDLDKLETDWLPDIGVVFRRVEHVAVVGGVL